jgi:hypothetical protein
MITREYPLSNKNGLGADLDDGPPDPLLHEVELDIGGNKRRGSGIEDMLVRHAPEGVGAVKHRRVLLHPYFP